MNYSLSANSDLYSFGANSYLLKTASNALSSNRPLHIAEGLKNAIDFINKENLIDCHSMKVHAAQLKTAIDNLDYPKMIILAKSLKEETDKVMSKISETSGKSESSLTKIVKRAMIKEVLPETNIVIKCKNGDIEDRAKYLSILGSALRIELDSDCCSLHDEGGDLELQADIVGSPPIVKSAALVVADGISEAFYESTGISIDVNVKSGSSDKPMIDHDFAEKLNRRFIMKIMGEGGI